MSVCTLPLPVCQNAINFGLFLGPPSSLCSPLPHTGVLFMLALPSVSCAVAPATTIVIGESAHKKCNLQCRLVPCVCCRHRCNSVGIGAEAAQRTRWQLNLTGRADTLV